MSLNNTSLLSNTNYFIQIINTLQEGVKYLNEIQEIKSRFEQIKLDCERLTSVLPSKHNDTKDFLEDESTEIKSLKESINCEIVERKLSSGGNHDFQEPFKDVCMDLHSMLEKCTFSDISIVCGSEVLRAHKIVLSARSPVFETMFTSPMQESQTDTVCIDDIDSSTMSTMLAFMYSGHVKDLSVSSSCNLLYAAVKYQMEGLKKICIQYLTDNLSTQNAIKLLIYGNLYDEILKQEVMSFIHRNFSSLKGTEEWNEMQSTNPTLTIEVYSYVVDRFQEKEKN